MRVTIELDDELHREAKLFAAEHGLTLRALVTKGLVLELARDLEGSAGVTASENEQRAPGEGDGDER